MAKGNTMEAILEHEAKGRRMRAKMHARTAIAALVEGDDATAKAELAKAQEALTPAQA